MEVSFHSITPQLFAVLTAISILFLYFSAFITASEVSVFSIESGEIEEIGKKNKKKAATILSYKRHKEYILASFLVLDNLVNIAFIVLANYALQIVNISNAFLFILFKIIVISLLVVLVGEIMPRIYAQQRTAKCASAAVTVLPFFLKLMYPVSKLLLVFSKITNKKIAKHSKDNISVSELTEALENADNIQEDKDILEGIVKFGSISVAEVMTPRLNIVDIGMSTKYTDLISKITEFGYSRMPVYEESHDNVKGILYIKDLLPHLDKKDDFLWQSLVRPAYFVPETKKIDDLLEEFQKNKIHMAIVVDEFGGTSGIITMEDILEEIVGDISDEYDNDEPEYQKLNDSTYIFEAGILLVDFFRITGIDEGEFTEITSYADSLGGMILEIKGEIPVEEEKIEYKNYTFTIISADNRKIEKVKFHINEK